MAGGLLLRWYDRARRDLPWRNTRDPYQILVSEVMLQQTRVAAALEPYRRFVQRFPDASALAAAQALEVRVMWSGLGYYRRAERLHQAARAIVARGEVPSDPEELRRLPGVGRYTAAAVASIAFGVAEPALDGNVVRVLARLRRDSGDPNRAVVRARLEETARALLDPRRPGDSNQALMELGATVCLPTAPRCRECPLAGGCRSRGAAAERYPRRDRRHQERQRESWLVLVVESSGRWLLLQRPEGPGFLAGSWLLPWADAGRGEAEALRDAERRYGVRFALHDGIRARTRHAITFRDIEATVVRARLDGVVG
ncbi:MAG TPA: A/G-specific adenine glycosylase, partial [Thermoanaerobaculia bacterium]|nr:A/G-specific adenine glycosylase [Thermoanaerobaculia bacterium]